MYSEKNVKNDSKTLQIGIAEEIINPTCPSSLAGYGAFKRISKGVHDNLHTRCLILKTEQSVVALLSASVVSLESEITADIRKEASKITGIPCSNILIHATHTHSAPHIKGDYRNLVQKACVSCLKDAWGNRFPGKIGTGSNTVDYCGKNRRYLDYGGLPVDPEIGIIKVEDSAGNLRGILFNYPCHCTTLDSNNLLITEDWPYFTVHAIKEKVGENVNCLFFNGAEGDINPGYSAGLSAVGAEIPIRTWEKARIIGERVANSILSSLDSIKTKSDIVLKSCSSFVDLPLRDSFPITLENAKQKLNEAKLSLKKLQNSQKASFQKCIEKVKVDVFFAELVYNGAKDFYTGKRKKSVRAELQTILLDATVITTFPGEVFVEVGLTIKKQSQFQKTFIIGLANSYEAKGYLPTKSAFAEGDYEVFSTRYSEEAADILIDASLKQIKQLKK